MGIKKLIEKPAKTVYAPKKEASSTPFKLAELRRYTIKRPVKINGHKISTILDGVLLVLIQ